MTVANHLTLNELWRRVKKTQDPIEKDRFLAIYHAKQGLTAKEIARITLNTPRWVQETVRRYNQKGPESLRDRRHHNPGQRPKLTPEEQRKVLEALQGPPPDGGLWTGPKLRDWVEKELGKKLSLYPIYRLLHEMGFALRVPRPRHVKAEEAVQEAFKKTSLPRSRRPGRRVRLLAYDEHRLGLRPVYRRVWARRGERPWAVVAPRYQWFYVCTFVEPETGESLSLLVDGIDTEVMGWVLRELGAWLGEGEEAWVVLDRAGWHVSPKVEVPEGVRRVFLPPYSPELQPVEALLSPRSGVRVWPLVNEAVANRYFETLEAMMEGVAERCRVLEQDPETLRRHTLFHWWPRTKTSA